MIRSAIILIFIFSSAGFVQADMLGNPGVMVGKKNLFVGAEYSSILHEYKLDTKGIDTSSERVNLKVTTGVTDWLDIFVKGGGANLTLDYKAESNAIKNFDSDFGAGFGGGVRVRLLNFVDSGTRMFFHGGGYFFKADDNIIWQSDVTKTVSTDREIKWADMYASLGIAKRIDFIDLNFGVGFSEIKWWINDVEKTKTGSAESKLTIPERKSFESRSPVFGFVGIDFVLPYEYRISAQAGIRNVDEAEFSVAISQGLERK
jgi:hypothetical protein